MSKAVGVGGWDEEFFLSILSLRCLFDSQVEILTRSEESFGKEIQIWEFKLVKWISSQREYIYTRIKNSRN